MLWGDLHTLFKPDENDEIWKDQHEYNLISWRLCDFCGIHILLMENGLAIHMLTEKKYPLSQEMLTKMLSRKLEVDHESSQAFKLLSVAIGGIHPRVTALEEQVQTLQTALHESRSKNQQWQTTVAEMHSREGTLMQYMLWMEERLTVLEKRLPGPPPGAQ
ncbi:hypothetical protein Tco_1011724 [Tanacetum coccineum]